MYSCVSLSIIFTNDPLKSFIILLVSSFLIYLTIFSLPHHLSLLIYQVPSTLCFRNTILGCRTNRIRKVQQGKRTFLNSPHWFLYASQLDTELGIYPGTKRFFWLNID